MNEDNGKSTCNNLVCDDLSLKNFKLDRIMFNDEEKRTIGLLGKFPTRSEIDQALIIIEKVEFTKETFTTEDKNSNFLMHTDLVETVLSNDIYANFIGATKSRFSSLKISRIYPATEKHIIKYTEQMLFLIEETPVDYITITLPYLKYEQFTLDWVYNIIEHKQETERILYEDLDPKNGFILLPDYKWNGQIETLYLLAIVMRKDIKSIRDLDSNHLPLLENIRSKSLEIIKKKYDINSNQIRAYFHYQPSFYHLHVHFTILKYKAPGINCEKSHLLNNVIDNIKMIPDYYQKATLTFSVREMDKLRHAFEAQKKVSSI